MCGSSPPARGTRRPWPLSSGDDRFIPACAGNTSSMTRKRPWFIPEHCSIVGVSHRIGSSPPARGTPDPVVHHSRSGRFIPACAGNTVRCLRGRRGTSVHPRLRGEHNIVWSTASRHAGSSPPARGTLFPQDIDSKGVAAHQKPHQLRIARFQRGGTGSISEGCA